MSCCTLCPPGVRGEDERVMVVGGVEGHRFSSPVVTRAEAELVLADLRGKGVTDARVVSVDEGRRFRVGAA